MNIMMSNKKSVIVLLLLFCAAMLHCGWLVFRMRCRVALSDGFEWEYIGENISRIIKEGNTVLGPGGIEAEDKGAFIIGTCLDADTFRSSWFIIDKKTRSLRTGENIDQLMANSEMLLQAYAETNNLLRLKTFQSWKRQ